MTIHRIPLALTALLGTFLLASSAHASLLVYEGFQYGNPGSNQVTNPADPNYNLLHNQPDGVGGDIDATGLSGVWQDTLGPGGGNDLFLSPSSLLFGDLPTLGNHVRSDTNSNNDNFGRPITASLNVAPELWFSVLLNKLQNNFSAGEGGLVIGNQQVGNNRIYLNDGTDGLQGFGIAPTTAGNNWTAFGWNGSSQTVGGANLNVATNGTETNLMVGKVEIDAGTGGADIYTLYQYQLNAGSIVGGTLNPITSIEVNVDQTTLDFLSITRQVNVAYDEIRIGTSLAYVLGQEGAEIPEPTTVALLGLAGVALFARRRIRS